MTFLAVLHIIGALLLIVLVLIQDSKGAMGGSFGGGGGGSSSSILGPTGATSFLFKMTRYVVIGFALTSLLLTKYTSNQSSSALDELPAGTSTTAPVIPGNEAAPSMAPETTPAETPVESN